MASHPAGHACRLGTRVTPVQSQRSPARKRSGADTHPKVAFWVSLLFPMHLPRATVALPPPPIVQALLMKVTPLGSCEPQTLGLSE